VLLGLCEQKDGLLGYVAVTEFDVLCDRLSDWVLRIPSCKMSDSYGVQWQEGDYFSVGDCDLKGP
jgi:hypothetical protein